MHKFHITRRAAALLLALCAAAGVLLSTAGCASDQAIAEGVGGLINNLPAAQKPASPEEAVEQFFAALSAQDVEAMLSLCDIEGYCERFSFEDYTARMQMSALGNISAPTEYPFYRELMVYERQRDFVFRIRALAYSLLTVDEGMEDYLNGAPMSNVDGAWAAEFAKTVDPAQLQGLEVLRVDENQREIQSDSRTQENLRAANLADNVVSRSALLELDGKLFCKSFLLAEIDGGWQVAAMYSPISGESAMGAATVVESEADYLEMIQ